MYYAPNCFTLGGSGLTCYPHAGCSGTYDTDVHWNFGFACAIRECSDRKIHKPMALNILIMDRCDWVSGSGYNATSCRDAWTSFGFGERLYGVVNSWGLTDFFSAWDYARMLVGFADPDRPRYPDPAAPVPYKNGINGLEQHELGHVLDLNHTYDCGNNRNALDKKNPDDSTDCDVPPDGPDLEVSRSAGYYTESIEEWNGTQVNQVELAVTAARNRVHDWSCH